jgi:hypothetical protein
MRKIILLFALLLSIGSAAQGIDNTIHFVVNEIGESNVGFLTEDGKQSVILSFPGKKANDLYTDVLIRTVRMFKSIPVAPQVINGKAFVLSGETDDMRANTGLSSVSLVSLKYNILFEFKDGKIRVHAPEAPIGTQTVMGTGSTYTVRLSNIYKNDKEAIKKIEDFFQKLINSIAFPNSDDNW